MLLQLRIARFVPLLLQIASPAAADLTTTISTASNWGTWEGWGVSLGMCIVYLQDKC